MFNPNPDRIPRTKKGIEFEILALLKRDLTIVVIVRNITPWQQKLQSRIIKQSKFCYNTE